jgi:hypothetical protein
MKPPRLFRGPIVGLALFIVTTSAWCSSDNWSSQFPPPPQTDGDVLAVASQGTGFYVGGDFTTVSGVSSPGIAKWNGTTWEAVGGGVDGTVSAIVISGTNVYVGGSFDQAGQVSALNVAAWNGTAWTALAGGIDDDVNEAQINAMAASGSKLYVGGQFDLADGNSATNIACWNGTAWSALNDGINYDTSDTNDTTTASVNALAYNGTNLYVGGTFNLAGTKTVTNMAKWNGSSWAAVGSGLDYVPFLSSDTNTPSVNALAFIGTNICAGGVFNVSGSVSLGNLAEWNGTSWSSLGVTDDEVDAIYAVSASEIYVGGAFDTIDNVPASTVALWNGANWNPLDTGSDGTVYALALTGNLLIAGGSFDSLGEANATSIGQWDGISWAALGNQIGNSPDNQVNACIISETNVYLGGSFVTAGGVTLNGMADWTGNAWQPLGNGVNGYVTALAADGNALYVGGLFMQDDVSATNIALWNGAAWELLGAGVDDEVDAIATVGGTLYIGGQFLNSGTNPINYIASWDGTNWNPLGAGLDGPVSALLAVGTNLYVGGAFANAGNVTVSNIARWDGAQWWPVGAGFDGPVSALTLLGTNLYAGGSFDTTTNSLGNIAQWDGTEWNDVGGGIDGPVEGLATIGTVLFATGSFANAGTNAASNIARWDGTFWAPLGGGLDQPGDALAVSGSSLYVGGTFMNAGLEPSGNFAEWNDAPPSFWLTPNSPAAPLTLGTNFVLTVGATGDLPLAYQWRHNGTNIPGATSTTYTDTNLQAGDVGNYTVIVTNAAGSAICDPAQVFLDSVTVFFENFASGKMTNWTTVSGGTALTISTNESYGGTYSALCGVSTAKMYHNLSPALIGHTRATFWIYDNKGKQNRWFGSACAYSGAGYGNGALQQILAIGLYNTPFGTNNTGTLDGDTVEPTNYQGEVYAGDNTGYFNLDQPPAPGRSVGWHEFQIERQSDGATVDFSVDGVLGQEIDGTTNEANWNTVTIGSVGTGSTNGNVWFDNIAIEYLDPPVITVGPATQTANAGTTVTFSVTATGDGTLAYQWQCNGTNIAKATNSVLSLTNINSGSAGDYTVSVQNGIGPVVSDDAFLALNTAPVITTPPMGETIPAGSSLALEVVAEGTPSALSYQWRANGVNIPGAIYSEYDIYNATVGQTNYSVVVTNVAGAVTSVVATVVVTNSPPVLLAGPQSQNVVLGGNATFFVQAIGSEPLFYQWQFNDSNIAGATASAYRTPPLQTNSAGNYSVVVSNSFAAIISSNAVLTLDYPPVIVTQPAGLTTPSGSNIFLTVTATGTPVLNYDWRKDGMDFQTTGPTLELDDVQSSDSGTYSVIVYSSYGDAISSNVVLTVNGPPSILQQPQDISTNLGSDAIFSVEAVGSGTLTYQWRKEGAPLPGATSSNYSIAAITTNDLGVYSVIVGNNYGSTSSDDAFLTQTNDVVFYDGFETDNLTNWIVFTGATALSISTNEANSGTNSALCDNSSQKMCHTLPIEVENHAISTFFIYDNQGTQNQWWGQTMAYGGIFSNTPIQILGAGRYDLDFPTNGQTGDMVGITVDTNYYQAFVQSGSNTGYINLDGGGWAPTRSVGWHEFDVERLDDNVTINFYVDQVLAATVSDATPATWDAVSIGSSGTGATNGDVWFDDVLVQYLDPPDILADPQDLSVNLGQTALFNVWATGNVQSYQWLFNGAAIPGATATNLVITNVQAANLGAYSVIAMNGIGPTESDAAILSTNIPPSIITEPQGLTALSGSAVSFTVVASGDDPLVYQWTFNAAPMTGETNAELDLPDVAYTNAGSYAVVITNAGGSVTSTPAVLIVRPPAAPSLGSAAFGSNGFQLVLSGETNGNYTIQSSTNLTCWTTLTNFTLTSGTFEFTDAQTNFCKFYRAIGQ